MVSYAYDEVRQQPAPTGSLIHAFVLGAQKKCEQCIDKLTGDEPVDNAPSCSEDVAATVGDSPVDSDSSKIDLLLRLVEAQGKQIEAQGKQIEAILDWQNTRD